MIAKRCLVPFLMLAACGSDLLPGEDASAPIVDAAPTSPPDAADATVLDATVDALFDAAVDRDATADVSFDAPSPDAATDAHVVDAQDATPDGPAFDAGAGTCTPYPGADGVFDPDCVYLLGTYAEGSAGYEVVNFPDQPAKELVGFTYYASGAQVRPTDGKMLYTEWQKSYVFVPEPYTDAGYPKSTLSNDLLIAAPQCAVGNWRVRSFPDDGAILYGCSNENDAAYLQNATTKFGAKMSEIVALGNGRTALLQRSNSSVLTYSNGAEHPVATGLANSYVWAARSRPSGGFYAALQTGTSAFGATLYSITPEGTATVIGVYNTNANVDSQSQYVLDSAGRLYAFASEPPGSFSDVIVRYSVSAPAEVIYREQNNRVKIHISELFTGP